MKSEKNDLQNPIQSSSPLLSLSTIIQSLEDLETANVKNPIQSSKQPETPIQEPTENDQIDTFQETPVSSFRFQVNPASKLKQALESLTDASFNPNGLGLIEVKENGLEITVRNTEIEVVGHLWLKSSGLVNFELKYAMINKMINMKCILDNLVDASNKDTVTLFHFLGSSQLNFVFGNASPREFAVELLEMDASFEKFPNITFACEAVILSDHFREMIEEYVSTTRIVSMNISDRLFIATIGESTWKYEEADGIRGMLPNTMHCAWFQMHHFESLKKALFIAKGLLLCLVTDPPKQIMLRFNLRELGDLVFISKAGYIDFDITPSDYDTFTSSLLALISDQCDIPSSELEIIWSKRLQS